MAGRRSRDLRVIAGVSRGEQVEERENFWQNPTVVLKGSWRWNKQRNFGWIFRALSRLGNLETKGGSPQSPGLTSHIWFSPSKREEANGGVHLQPLWMLLRSGILIPIENREETLPKAMTWGDTEVRHLLDLCLNPCISEGFWVPNIPKITMFCFPKHLRMLVT